MGRCRRKPASGHGCLAEEQLQKLKHSVVCSIAQDTAISGGLESFSLPRLSDRQRAALGCTEVPVPLCRIRRLNAELGRKVPATNCSFQVIRTDPNNCFDGSNKETQPQTPKEGHAHSHHHTLLQCCRSNTREEPTEHTRVGHITSRPAAFPASREEECANLGLQRLRGSFPP